MNLTDWGRGQVKIKLRRTRGQWEGRGGEGLYGVTFKTQLLASIWEGKGTWVQDGVTCHVGRLGKGSFS